jgi:hypothetical protein
MKLFKIVNWQLEVEEELWTIEVFNNILKRDKSKSKETAMKEMAFIYHFCDVKSDYVYITNKKDRVKEVAKDVGLPTKWVYDKAIEAACDLYLERAVTVSETLYKSSLKSAMDISEYLDGTKSLLAERDDRGKPVHTINSITGALKGVPDIMKNLKISYKELVKEQNDLADKSKGQKQFGMFEDGLTIED